ncbi:hypothetical protein V512_013630 [Mesotoga sp. Brook.08.105.5.1]|nr:hypothetical protein V512_013630 [Mesotoga sp. Brook.08.105.5.1]RAO96050.1 hypothetical protein M388_15215 [Mesotoga sp. Brook.08.YT.4.2.5.4.]
MARAKRAGRNVSRTSTFVQERGPVLGVAWEEPEVRGKRSEERRDPKKDET